MPGPWASTTVKRRSGDHECPARRFDTDVRGQLSGRLHEFGPSSKLIPNSSATFPCTSMIRCAFLSSFSSRAFCRSSLRTVSSSGLCSDLRPRFFDSAFSDPSRTALRHVVRLDEYRPSRRRMRPTSPSSVHRSTSSRIRSLYDGLNRRRLGFSMTSGSGGAAALRLPSRGGGAIPFSLAVPASSISLPSPYSNSLRAPCLTYVGREGPSSSSPGSRRLGRVTRL
jgi:hypothetical protein